MRDQASSPATNKQESNRICRISGDVPQAAERLADHLRHYLQGRWRPSEPPVAFCIGTDRSTGDSLGPLTGEFLLRYSKKWRVFGSLSKPVHACNLEEAISEMKTAFPNSIVLAIDACLGRMENIGSINLGSGPLYPGTGVNKTLPSVGDLYMTGTVNVGGFMEYFVLQNTRLSVVYRLAETIARSILLATDEHSAFPKAQVSLHPQEGWSSAAAAASLFPGK